jgi:MoaA/NifB/PqqE/SkfB family radical SAM enzyme/SAM-dependent methyltransferase
MSNATSGKALLRIGHACNNACVFCHAKRPEQERLELDGRECRRRIKTLANAGIKTVVFTGGEPSIRKDIIPLCRYAANLGLSSGLITNGRMLSYKDFTQKLVNAGVSYLLISLHGDSPDLHNRHTGTDSFHQTISGLAAAAQHPLHLIVNTVLTSLNADRLVSIHRLVSRFAPIHHKISLPEPKGRMLENLRLGISPNNATDAVVKLLRSRRNSKATIGFDGFTPCLLPDYFILNDDFFTHGFSLIWYPGEDSFSRPDRGHRSYARTCLYCTYYGLCPGVYTQFLSAFPNMTLQPLQLPVSNAVRFNLTSTHAKPDNPCLAPFMSVPDPERRIAVSSSRKIRIYSTSEQETDIPELHAIKFNREQVYLIDSSKEMTFHTPQGHIKMELTERCRDCVERIYTCPGIFRKSRNNPFSKSLLEAQEVLAEVKGRVCEVGCGQGPLFDLFKQKQARGEISLYLGLDPALPNPAPFSAPGFILKNVRFEDLQWNDTAFDYVILFRSYCHLEDLAQSMSVLDRITKNGSILIITEDLKHIELHSADAQRSDTHDGFQHYRNSTAQDASRILKTHGFRICKATATGKRDAYHWLLVAEKA